MVQSNSHPKNVIYMFLMNFPINTWTSDLNDSSVQLQVPDQTVKDYSRPFIFAVTNYFNIQVN